MNEPLRNAAVMVFPDGSKAISYDKVASAVAGFERSLSLMFDRYKDVVVIYDSKEEFLQKQMEAFRSQANNGLHGWLSVVRKGDASPTELVPHNSESSSPLKQQENTNLDCCICLSLPDGAQPCDYCKGDEE